MESIVAIILQELEALINQTQSIEALLTQQIIALEKITNHTYKSIVQPMASKEAKQKMVEKVEVPEINVEQKIKDLISHIQYQQKNIQNNVKPKVQSRPVEPVIEKKPPLPSLPLIKTAKNFKNSTPAYVPPRNQNQVTAKITQNVLKTSANKVFKPEKTGMKRQQSRQKPKPIEKKVSAQKIERNETKIVSKVELKQTKYPEKESIKPDQIKSQVKQQQKPTKPVIKEEHKKQASSQKRIEKIASFTKTFEEILESLIGNNQANHKNQLKKLLTQYSNQQKGYRMHEQTNRNSFIKKANNYAISKHQVNSLTTHQLNRKRWIYHNQLFIYEQLLQNLDKEISNLQQLKDCRIDPKQQYRLKKSMQTYESRIDQIISESKQVPSKIELSFQYTSIKTNSQVPQQASIQSINEIKVHEELLRLLQQLADKGSLQRKQMRCLQVLSQIGIFKGKRSPNIILKKDYEKWKSFYED